MRRSLAPNSFCSQSADTTKRLFSAVMMISP
jgi:hypothetical protein